MFLYLSVCFYNRKMLQSLKFKSEDLKIEIENEVVALYLLILIK